MPNQLFQNLIKEGERKTILLRGIIEFSIINAYTLTRDCSSKYKCVSFILDNDHTRFLENYLHQANHFTI